MSKKVYTIRNKKDGCDLYTVDATSKAKALANLLDYLRREVEDVLFCPKAEDWEVIGEEVIDD